MGVSLPGGGGGRGKNMNASVNLVPFIDLLSTLITFLIATAVWVQTNSMQVDQAISDPNAEPPPSDTPPTPPMTLHIRADGLWMGRNVEAGKNFPKIGEDYDWEAVKEELKADHEALPDETQVVIVTDDGSHYVHMMKALDVSREIGYDKTLLGGGPAQNNASMGGPPPAG